MNSLRGHLLLARRRPRVSSGSFLSLFLLIPHLDPPLLSLLFRSLLPCNPSCHPRCTIHGASLVSHFRRPSIDTVRRFLLPLILFHPPPLVPLLIHLPRRHLPSSSCHVDPAPSLLIFVPLPRRSELSTNPMGRGGGGDYRRTRGGLSSLFHLG